MTTDVDTDALDLWLAEHLLGWRWKLYPHAYVHRFLAPPGVGIGMPDATGTEELVKEKRQRPIPKLSTTGDGMLTVMAALRARSVQTRMWTTKAEFCNALIMAHYPKWNETEDIKDVLYEMIHWLGPLAVAQAARVALEEVERS